MRAAFAAALAALFGPALAAPPQWTWEAGKQTNNGSITIKSYNGSTTYSGTQNPTRAVAKLNQSAVTQPPTVIIQATGSGSYVEVIPLLSTTSSAIPMCPDGYSAIWSGSSTKYGSFPIVYNAAGTRFNLIGAYWGNTLVYGWWIDSPHGYASYHKPVENTGYWQAGYSPSSWSANLCSK